MDKRIRALKWCAGIGAVFLFVWQQVQSVRLGYELERTRRMVESQRERNAYLRLNLERTLSPEWIAEIAKTRLGMQPSSPGNLIILETQDSDGEPRKDLFSIVNALRTPKRVPTQTLISRVFAVSAVR